MACSLILGFLAQEKKISSDATSGAGAGTGFPLLSDAATSIDFSLLVAKLYSGLSLYNAVTSNLELDNA